MTKIEKAGMLINAEKAVIGWVNAGDEMDLNEGDLVVSHPKTAEKHGVAEQYVALKAENAPAKEKKAKKEKAEGDATRTRKTCPMTGTYVVVKADAANLKEGEDATERHALLSKLLTGTSFDSFWKDAPEKFNHPARDGSEKTFSTSGLVLYAIDRGMITVNA